MISIAMATYNGQNYIKEQLDSILSQTYKDFELIICDDCSKDKTPSILKEYTAKDSRITVFINDTNLGFKKNFEKAIQNCHGEYIAFCDQDDIWTPNHLEILYSQIENKDLICGNAKLIDSNGNDMNTTTHECLSSFILPESSTEQFKNLLYGNFAQGTAMMITKELAQKIIPIPQTVKYHDWWAASIASLNNGCKYTDEIVLLYRQHGTNQTVTNKYNITTAIKHAIEKKQEMKLEYQEKIKYSEELQERFLTNLSEYKDSKAFQEYKASISECIDYYSGLLSKKRKSKKLFKKNYNSIYWVRNPSSKLYFLRFIKVFILNI
jgi:glycosyltransferase involved in cell wall biosynthesis